MKKKLDEIDLVLVQRFLKGGKSGDTNMQKGMHAGIILCVKFHPKHSQVVPEFV